MNGRELKIGRRLRACRGNSLLETALVLPLLLLVTFSIIEFGCLFYTYLALENGVSQATRYGVTGNQMASLSRDDSIKATMRDATPTLTIPDGAFSFSHLPKGGSTWLAGAGGPGEVERVTVDYTWNVMTPLLWPFFSNGQYHIQVNSSMRNESLFQ
jgi:Flp pilus assembly protein TadG